jgi:S-adenosylmethionine hydrolase
MTHRPIITLTTDFGGDCYYVGAMRGVILSRCPEATLVDITHQVTPFNPLEGSFILSQACPTFPEGTIHLAVVDPGVGGLRKPIIVQSRGHCFVGPDNGLFTPFLDGNERVFRIREETIPDRSDTFHGRDIFAPVVALLGAGKDPGELGEATGQAVHLHIPRPRRERNGIVGQVLYSDRFGNLITNIHRNDVEPLGAPLGVQVGTCRIPHLSRTYGDGSVGESLALFGSSGFLELAVVQGSAGGELGVGKGERVRVQTTGRP